LVQAYAKYGGAIHIQRDRNWFLAATQLGGAATASDDWLTPAIPRIARTLEQIVGSWCDERSVDEIVQDIYENRTL